VEQELLELTDYDQIQIQVEILPDARVDYFLVAEGKKRKLLRKDIRSILESLHIQAENKLAFTEEGTVNIFSDHSDRMKLDLLLETTGLSIYRDNLLLTLDTLASALRSVEPLHRKLAVEQGYLKSMENSRKILMQKAELLKKHRQLMLEEAWSQVAQIEREMEQLGPKLSTKYAENKKGAAQVREMDREIEQQEAALEKLKKQRERLAQKLDEGKNELRTLDGQNQSNRRMLKNTRQKLEELRLRQENFLQGKTSPERRQELEKELKKIQEEKARITTAAGNDFVSDNLCPILKAIVAGKAKIPKLLEIAQNTGKKICTENKLYLPWPGVCGICIPKIFSTKQSLSLEEWQEALETMATYQKMLSREKELQAKIKTADAEGQISFLEEWIAELQQEADALQKEIDTNTSQHRVASKKVEETKDSYDEIVEALDNGAASLRKIEEKSIALEKEQENIEKVISILDGERKDLEEKLSLLVGEAEGQGERPAQVRTVNVVNRERLKLEGKLETLQVSSISEEDLHAQEERVVELEKELAGVDEHLNNLKADTQRRLEKWHGEVVSKMEGISASMNRLMSQVSEGVRIYVDDLKKPETAGLRIEVKRHGMWHDLSHLSGGEKVLAVEALILSLHLQTDSPLHAIDECTQRLDIEFKSQAFNMAYQALLEIQSLSHSPFAPQFILLSPDTLGVQFTEESEPYFKRIVLSAVKFKAGKHVAIVEEERIQ
jgi:chromosome segregation ATPase